MAALSADRNTPRRDGATFTREVAADVNIYAGALVVLNAGGYAEPGATATGLVTDGRAEFDALNGTGSNGALTVAVRPGIYRWDNSSGGDTIAQANIGANCYVVDDHTVALTSGSGTRSIAGQIRDVDSIGVWVMTGPAGTPD